MCRIMHEISLVCGCVVCVVDYAVNNTVCVRVCVMWCRIVTETLKEVEEEQEAIEAEMVRMNSSLSKDRESSPDHIDVCIYCM